MRIKCIGCEVLARTLYGCAATSPNTIDIELLAKGLHDQPANLNKSLQEKINEVPDTYQATVLAYGLCGKSTLGLTVMKMPLVVPRAHDCITLFLGSRERYQEQFDLEPGTYWYEQDYLERSKAGDSSLGLGSIATTEGLEKQYSEYVAKYGKDNADYLMEVMGAWQQHYHRAALIDMNLGDISQAEQSAKAEAEQRKWKFEKLPGDLALIRRLLDGDWNEDFLVLQPGQTVEMTFDSQILGCAGCNQK
jgi:hypothetical protein